jgi:uncharacterized membrane protein YkgB
MSQGHGTQRLKHGMAEINPGLRSQRRTHDMGNSGKIERRSISKATAALGGLSTLAVIALAKRASLGRSPKHNHVTTRRRMDYESGVGTRNQCSEARPGFLYRLSNSAKSNLTKLAALISDRNIPFLVTSIGMIVMLLWAGSYKMTDPGAEGIIPLVSNSPLISWHFRLFGPYVGADIIGLTEIVAAILIIAGYVRPKAGIIGGFITTLMFFITSTMVITTPGAVIAVHGMRYMSFLGLFLFKDIISLGVSFYLISYFGKKAILSDKK